MIVSKQLTAAYPTNFAGIGDVNAVFGGFTGRKVAARFVNRMKIFPGCDAYALM